MRGFGMMLAGGFFVAVGFVIGTSTAPVSATGVAIRPQTHTSNPLVTTSSDGQMVHIWSSDVWEDNNPVKVVSYYLAGGTRSVTEFKPLEKGKDELPSKD